MNEPDIHDSEYVRDLFDRVSNTYGYTNYLASFGFTARWRRHCISKLDQLRSNECGYDLMCGRGETWVNLLSHHPTIRNLIGLDISSEMIKGAKIQANRLEADVFEFMELDVFKNDIPSDSADFVVSTFGIKTFTNDQQRLLASEVNRILKPGGIFSFVEVSYPKGWIFAPLYMFYLSRVMPVIEKIFLGCSYGYSAIGLYVAEFGDCRHFCSQLESHGLRVIYEDLFFGCASSVSGIKAIPNAKGEVRTDVKTTRRIVDPRRGRYVTIPNLEN